MKNKKRKFKKFFNKNGILIFIVSVATFVLLMTTGYATLKTDLSLKSEASIVKTQTTTTSSASDDQTKTCETYITYSQTTSWQEGTNLHYQLNLTLTNNSSTDIINWRIKFSDSNNYTLTSYNGTVTNSNDKYYISNLSYNGTISSGGNISIVIDVVTARTDIDTIMKSIYIVDCGRASSGEDKTITSGNASLSIGQLETQLDAEVKTTYAAYGFNQYEIKITNNSAYKITNWRGNVYFGDSKLQAIWSVTQTQTNTNNVLISDNGNGSIAIGGSVTLYLQLTTNDTSYVPNVVFAGTYTTS